MGLGFRVQGIYIAGGIEYGRGMGEVIDGKRAAAAVRAQVRGDVAAFQREFGYVPGLATVLVGDSAASASYVRSKRKACAEVGMLSEGHELPAHTTQAELLNLVE